MSDWQPIETAPRDGTPILAWGTLHAVGWNDGEAPSIQIAVYGYANCDCWYAPAMGGWKPSRWMPIPDPPKDPQ
jgi:hypothetical protein